MIKSHTARATWSQGNLSFIANSHHFINSSEYITDLKMTDIFIISLASAIRWYESQLSFFKVSALTVQGNGIESKLWELKSKYRGKKVNCIETQKTN